MDYHFLNDPWEDEMNVAQTILSNGDPKTLKEAKNSPEWPEWESTVLAELSQLQEMGTWQLVKRPTNAIPIANRWVFMKKYSCNGELLRLCSAHVIVSTIHNNQE